MPSAAKFQKFNSARRYASVISSSHPKISGSRVNQDALEAGMGDGMGVGTGTLYIMAAMAVAKSILAEQPRMESQQGR